VPPSIQRDTPMKSLSTAMWFSQEKELKKSNLKEPYYPRKSGEGWAFNKVEAGLILGFISKHTVIIYTMLKG